MTRKRAIAIVDDDALVRSSMVSLVRSFGLDAAAFDRAAALLEAGPGRWDCLISDVHMPQMTGLELARRLQRTHPALPIVLITAFPDEHIRAQVAAGAARRLLEKPCGADALQAVLEEVLGPL